MRQQMPVHYRRFYDKNCEVCSEPFRGRSDKKYCSNRCKMKAREARKG